MKRHPFLIFLLAITFLISGALAFIQSESFARVLKGFVASHLPGDLGIHADFSDLSVGLFPPSVSIRNPKIQLSRHNLINLPPGSSVKAKRIDLRFRLFQMFSGNIRINEVAVVDGDVTLVLHATPEQKRSTRPSLRPRINWNELFRIRAKAVALENTAIHVRFADSKVTADLIAEQLRLAQWKGPGGLGYELRADLKQIHSSVLEGWVPPSGIERLSAIAHVNAHSLELDDLATMLEGVDIHGSGVVKGNVLTARQLPFETELKLRADLSSVSKMIAKKKKIESSGLVKADIKTRGDLLRLQDTLRAQGQVVGKDVRYGRWYADHVVLDGGYKARASGKHGEITLAHAEVSSQELPRLGGDHPASGGRLEVGGLDYVIGSRKPISIPLQLEHAHIQWLAAGVVNSVYPIDSRFDGKILATFKPASGARQPWSIDADLNLSSDSFQLDNQRFGLNRPLKRVLKIPNLKLAGPIAVNPHGLTVSGVSLTLPHTHVLVNGTVSNKGDYDLLGKGAIRLQDVGDLAENPIAGDGTLSIHVHGPSSRVLIDFDSDLTDASYLHMSFGNLKGRITWDDGPQDLIFDHVQAIKGQTKYSVNGNMDLGKQDSIHLDAAFPSGNVSDLTQIFAKFTKKLWWFPNGITGPFKGQAQLRGGVSMARMTINTSLDGTDWEYLGERFRVVHLNGGYDKGKYQITDLHGIKQGGHFAGRISYDADKRFDWDFRTHGFEITDFDHFARLDVPFRGNVKLLTHGSGQGSRINSSTSVSVSNFSVRGANYPPSRFQLKTQDGIATGTGNAFGDQARIDFKYGFTPGTPSSIRAKLQELDFSPMILLFNPKLMQDPELHATASGSVRLDFPSGKIEDGTGLLALSDYRLEKHGTHFRLVHPVRAPVTQGHFDLHDLSLAGPTGVATLNLKGRPNRLEGAVGGKLDLGLAEFLTPTVAKATGIATLDYTIGGTLKAPTVYGSAMIHGGNLRVPAVDSPFENMTGTVLVKQNVLTIQNLESDLGGGRVQVGGMITLFPNKYPTLALHANLSGNRVRVFPFQYVKVSGKLGVNGEDRPYLIDGKLLVDSALTKKNILGARDEHGSQSLEYTPPSTAQGGSDLPLFRLKIDVAADHGILVKDDLFDAELNAHVTVVNTLNAPRIVGTAGLVHGEMKFKDRVFQIQSASAVFDNPNVIDPQFNLTATTEVSNTKVNFYASGRVSKWKLDLTSSPSLSESEILSLLALGNVPVDSSSQFSGFSVDRTAVQQGEAASLLLQSLDFNREVQEKTGFEFQLDEYENTLQGQSIFSRTGNEETVAPKIVIKRRIGDRITLSYGSTVGVDVNKQTEANAELHVTPGFSVIGVWDTYEFNDLQQKLDSQSSYGFDLRLQKRFR